MKWLRWREVTPQFVCKAFTLTSQKCYWRSTFRPTITTQQCIFPFVDRHEFDCSITVACENELMPYWITWSALRSWIAYRLIRIMLTDYGFQHVRYIVQYSFKTQFYSIFKEISAHNISWEIVNIGICPFSTFVRDIVSRGVSAPCLASSW